MRDVVPIRLSLCPPSWDRSSSVVARDLTRRKDCCQHDIRRGPSERPGIEKERSSASLTSLQQERLEVHILLYFLSFDSSSRCCNIACSCMSFIVHAHTYMRQCHATFVNSVAFFTHDVVYCCNRIPYEYTTVSVESEQLLVVFCAPFFVLESCRGCSCSPCSMYCCILFLSAGQVGEERVARNNY